MTDLKFEEAADQMFYALMHNNVDLIATGERAEEDYVDVPDVPGNECGECDTDDELGGVEAEAEEG